MRILVTGGAGFIGSHLVDALIQENHEVWVIDNLYSGFRENVNSKAHFVLMDILQPELAGWVKQHQFEVVYHLAAQMDVRKSVADPAFDARVNIIGTIHLLEGCVHSGVKRVIFASSGGTVYGELEQFPAPESHPIRPLSPYGITKATVEQYLYYYYKVYGLSYTALRYANIFGPRQNPHGEAGVVAIFAKKILEGHQPIINGDGLQTRDYLHVADVVQANLLALNDLDSDCYNVGSGIETNVVQLFDIINGYYGNKVERKHGPAKDGEVIRSVLKNEKIKKKLNWESKYDLASGLKDTLDWFQSQYNQ